MLRPASCRGTLPSKTRAAAKRELVFLVSNELVDRPEAAKTVTDAGVPAGNRLTAFGVADRLRRAEPIERRDDLRREIADQDKRPAAKFIRIPEGVRPPEIELAAAIVGCRAERINCRMTVTIDAEQARDVPERGGDDRLLAAGAKLVAQPIDRRRQGPKA